MQPPDVKHTLKDASSGVTYHVLAYRKLTRPEVIQAIRVYNSQQKKHSKVKRGGSVTIVTIIGA